MISLETARKLLFFGARISSQAAEEQLKGAVAVHNLLEKHGVAYLADEVGMGKTYVALGALALFRHFQPRFRVLIIAPRENIQKKWRKELQIFVSNCVRFPDLRVKALHDAPARSVVLCENLLDLVGQTALDADRDFLVRMPSFSLAVNEADDRGGMREQVRHWREHLPWLQDDVFADLRKREFKDAVGKAACAALPTFDLVIVDEAHHLKAGLQESGAFRNRVLALTMGHPELAGDLRRFKNYGPRAERVLFLSATPVEDDYRQLWNQLNVFNRGAVAPELANAELDAEERRAAAQRFVIRRITQMKVGDDRLTKNLYRREWRMGGVDEHDQPLPEPKDARARLAVALVQKKVSEVIDGKFGNRFQIGMLASFESFLQTAKLKTAEDAVSNFDDAEQAEDEAEREGADVRSINSLAKSYRAKFDAELPHPKMDAMVETLARSFSTGEKALVFVRRVASVKELQRKLEDRYDEWLRGRLERELAEQHWPRVQACYERYRADRAMRRERLHGRGGEDESTAPVDSFFAWFFRGDGPEAIVSGATVANRLNNAGGLQSTFFEDNHVARALDVQPAEVFDTLVARLKMPAAELTEALRARASTYLRAAEKQQRLNLFLAHQRAALELIAESDAAEREVARLVCQEHYADAPVSRAARDPGDPAQWLSLTTFWTELRRRPGLHALLPARKLNADRDAFREEELRRGVLSSMARLGAPLIDLYILLVNRLPTLEPRAREDKDASTELAKGLLDLLEAQKSSPGHHSYRELSQAAENLQLIVDVNAPDLRQLPLAQVSTKLGTLLRQQMPVGGMFEAVNEQLVRQFRMPGYPMVLITTDILQEGEDLHTFCSRIFHYGISWMPSSMEQRIGRIDRVSSETERRLGKLSEPARGEDKLQVHYPHLRQTVEVLQVQRVLDRMDTFVRMMHEDISAGAIESRHLDVSSEMLNGLRTTKHRPEHPLKTAFGVRPSMLGTKERALAVTEESAREQQHRFEAFTKLVLPGLSVAWESQHPRGALLGTADVLHRKQPFTLLARSLEGRMVLRCVSPVGKTSLDEKHEHIASTARSHAVRLAAVKDDRFKQYDLTVEADVLLLEASRDGALVAGLIQRVTTAADQIERTLLDHDAQMSEFRADLEEEPGVAR